MSHCFVRPGALSADWLHGSCGGRGLHAWLRPGRHLDLYIVFWTALHVVGVSLFVRPGSAVSADWLSVHGSCGGRGLHAWLRPGRHLNVYIILLLTLCLQCMDIGIDGQWYWVRHFGFRGPVSLGAWSTWRGPWAAGRPEWRVNAGCVDVYIRELDARGA